MGFVAGLRRHSVATAVAVGGIVLVGSVGVAGAATGDNFLLGKSNSAGKVTKLKNSHGTALSLTSKTGTAPLAVSNTTKVANFNADLLDGQDSTAFQSKIPALQWQNLALTNGWANYASVSYGQPGVQYAKDIFGFVHLKGTISGSAQTSVFFGNLPAGYRPASGAWFPVGSSNGGYNPLPVNAYVTSGGDIRVVNGPALRTGDDTASIAPNDSFISLEGATYYAG